jgi:hypothetical protein
VISGLRLPHPSRVFVRPSLPERSRRGGILTSSRFTKMLKSSHLLAGGTTPFMRAYSTNCP